MQFNSGSRRSAAPLRVSKRVALATTSTVVCLILVLSGCTAGDKTRDRTSTNDPISRDGFTNTAVLHADTGIVDLPLDHYEIAGPSYNALTLHARDSATNSCLSEHHLTLVKDAFGWKPSPRPLVWDPVIWSESLAHKYGFGSPNPPAVADPAVGATPEQNRQRSQCEQEGRDAGDSLAAHASLSETYSTLIEQARSASVADSEGKAALAEIAKCLSGKHVSVDPDTGLHGRSTDIMSREQQIPIAVAEAECATSTGGAQRYFDVLAQYQAALIEQNQAALDQGLEDQKAAEAQLTAFIKAEEQKK